MAGEIWRSAFQIGKETTAGTSVAATRKMYFLTDGSNLTRTADPRPKHFAVGRRDNVLAFTKGPAIVGGTLVNDMSSSEIIELALMGIQGGVTPTTPGGGTLSRLWTFKPGSTALDAATVEWDDGANQWEAAGCHVNTLRFAGSANGANTVTAEVFGRNLVAAALTGSLTDRVPDYAEGWETKFYLDALAGTPGTTNVSGYLISWDVLMDNQLGRKYFADNINAAGGITSGELNVTATLVVEAAATAADTAWTDYLADTLKLMRLEFGQNDVIESALKTFVTLDIPAAWSAVDLGQVDEGTRAYQLTGQYVYDPTNAFGFQLRAQNARTAAY
jgi:hypothetical protein